MARLVRYVTGDEADDTMLVLVDKQVEGPLVALLDPLNQQLVDLCFAHARTLRLSLVVPRDRSPERRFVFNPGRYGLHSALRRHLLRLPLLSIAWSKSH
jgi:hypothetical protein